jgi:hypothetical protein
MDLIVFPLRIGRSNRGFTLAAFALLPGIVCAQLTTGLVEGVLRAADGKPLPGASIVVTGEAELRTTTYTGPHGEFAVVLPYGRYRFSTIPEHGAIEVLVRALETTRLTLALDASETIHVQIAPSETPGAWIDNPGVRLYPEPFSLAGLLLSRDPPTVSQPLDFSGLADNRLALESQRGFSWTDTQFKLNGVDATDSYQPGRPNVFPDVQALQEVAVRSAFAQTTSTSYGTEAGLFVAEPQSSWHGAFSTADTDRALSSSNLPPPASRGLVRQSDQFRWFTRDHMEIGGPLTRYADLYASASGQWSSQTEPLSARADQRSRLLFATARARISASLKDQFDILYNAARIDLSDGGMPAAIEALSSNRLAPSFVLPGGFLGQPEADRFNLLQAGWTRLLSSRSGSGAIQFRYGYSTARLDTTTASAGDSRIELLGGAVAGAPPLANLAVRTRQSIAASWQPPAIRAARVRHRFSAGGEWKTSEPRNRFSAPSNRNLITAAGAPAFIIEFNTPLAAQRRAAASSHGSNCCPPSLCGCYLADSRSIIRSFSGYFADSAALNSYVSIDVGVLADFSRGGLPAGPARIEWNSLSPRAGFAVRVPRLPGLVVRGTYFRLFAPLAGRYLDFGNPNSLGGSVYQWTSSDANAPFQASQQGAVLARFGGPYSSIDPAIRRPYADEFDVSAEVSLPHRTAARFHLFRRDDKNRIALVDDGVPPQAFTPVSILDPGPDAIPGTFDDQHLIVYAQNSATLGQDRYLLTNPSGLRMLNTGLMAEVGGQWRQFALHLSFVAEKSYGPTNPGDAIYENDPGVVGALFLDPNTAIHASGRSFVDRAYVGKIQASYRLPAAFGGFELASVADYTDGLVFARQLLVTGLPQGPFLVATTVRGSPEGGNRAQYALNWNLRLARNFSFPFGNIAASADILNVVNAGQSLQENDLSSPSFNLRLPVAIQPPRMLRLAFRYQF